MATWCLFCAERGVQAPAAFTVDDDPACVHCAPVEAEAAGCAAVALRELVRMSPHAVMGAELLNPARPKPVPLYATSLALTRKSKPKGQRTDPACRVTPVVRAQIRAYPDGTQFRLIARETGASYEQVRALRKAEGMSGGRQGFGTESGRAAVRALNRARGEETWKRVELYIGLMPDKEVAKLAGICYQRVAQIRQERGIPAFTKAAKGGRDGATAAQ